MVFGRPPAGTWRASGILRPRAHDGRPRWAGEAAFKRYDRDGKGEMSALDVGKLLRWLGYVTTWDVQQERGCYYY